MPLFGVIAAGQGDLLGGLEGICGHVKAIGRMHAEKRDPDQGQNDNEDLFRRYGLTSAPAQTRKGKEQLTPYLPVSCHEDQLQDSKEKEGKSKQVFEGAVPCAGISSADQQQNH